MPATGMELATAYVSILPSTRGFAPQLSKQLGGANGAASSAGRTVGQKFAAGFSGAMDQLGKLVKRGLLAGAAVTGAAGAIGVKTAAEMETAQIAFETMLGSGKKAKVFLDQLAAFAAKTPFDLPGLQQSAQSLISIGIDSKKVIPIMTTLGNVTSGMGTGAEGIKRATVAIQQMNAAGRITAEDLNQLRDAGVPVFDLLTAATGKSTAEIAKMASSGKLGRKELTQLMAALESGKGLERFNGMMEKQSKSLSGIWSTLKDTFAVGMAEAIAPSIPLIKDGLNGALGLLESKILPRVQSGLEWIAENGPKGFRGIRELIVNGNFTKDLREAFNIEEDNPLLSFFFTAREAFTKTKAEISGGVTALVLAFQDGGRDITSSGFAGVLETIGLVLGNLWKAIGPAVQEIVPSVIEIVTAFSPLGLVLEALLPVLPGLAEAAGKLAGALSGVLAAALEAVAPLIETVLNTLADMIGWLTASEDRMKIAAAVIALVLTPALITWGVQAGIAAAKNVAAWTLARVEAVKTAISYSTQGIKIVASWVMMGIAAIKSGAETAAIWLMYRVDSAKALAAMVVAKIGVVKNWVAMSTAAMVSGAKTAAVWTAQVIKSAAVGAAQFAVHAAKVVGRWVFMGIQSLIHAGRMAAAWVIAMGPIGWVTAAVLTIAALIWANWDKIKRWTVNLWGGAMDKLAQFRDFITGKLTTAVTWLYDRTIKPIWEKVGSKISGIWKNAIKPIFDIFISVLKGDFPGAFKHATDLVDKYWTALKKIAAKPVDFVVNTVINKGLIGTFNKIARKIPGIGELPEVEWKGFSVGGWTGHGAKHQPAGVVHADEYVLRKEAQQSISRKAPGLLDSMNRFGARALGYASGGLVNPMDPKHRRVSAGWMGYPGHLGTDYPAPVGTPVYAPGDGYVARVGWNLPGGTGKQVWIQHTNGLLSRVHHLSSWLVKVGEKVRAGMAIGRVGMTGNTTGPHAHWGVMDGSKYLDPASVWGTGRGGSGGMGWLSGLFGLATKAKEMFGDKFQNAGFMLNIAKGVGTKLLTSAKDALMAKIGDIKDAVTGFVGSAVNKAKWTPVATKALWRTGNFSLGNLGSLLARMEKESGFNPRAVNNWDSNAKRGTPSKGLMQVIQPTFDRYRDRSLSADIFDPLANIVASINYTKARYGNLRAGWDRSGGYANGGLVTPTLYDGGGWLYDEGGPQLIDHRRRKPDAVLTNAQFADLHRLATEGRGEPSIHIDQVVIPASDLAELKDVTDFIDALRRRARQQ